MSEQFANHPGTTLTAAISSTARPVTFSVASSVGLPSSGNFRVLIDSEILLVTTISGLSLTGSNAEGTAAATHNSGTTVTHILTAGALVQLEADTVSTAQVGVPVWQKVTIPFSSLTAAGLTQTLTVLALSARQAVLGIVVKHSVAFAATSLTALTLTLGDSAQNATYYSATPFDCKQTVSNTAFQAVNVVSLGSFAGSNLQAAFTATGANLNTLSAGSVDFDICTVLLP